MISYAVTLEEDQVFITIIIKHSTGQPLRHRMNLQEADKAAVDFVLSIYNARLLERERANP